MIALYLLLAAGAALVSYLLYRRTKAERRALDWQDLGEYAYQVFGSFYAYTLDPAVGAQESHALTYKAFRQKTGRDWDTYVEMFQSAWSRSSGGASSGDTQEELKQVTSAITLFTVESYALFNDQIETVYRKDREALFRFIAQIESAAYHRIDEMIQDGKAVVVH